MKDEQKKSSSPEEKGSSTKQELESQCQLQLQYQCQYHEPLWLRGAHDREGTLRGAIESRQIVDNLELLVNHSFVESPDAALSIFVRASGLPGLRSLRILPEINTAIYELPVHLLTVALRQASKLAICSICGIELTGTVAEFQRFHRTLRRHLSLKRFRLIRCSLPEQDGSPNVLVNQLIEPLSVIPPLREIELSAAEEGSLGSLSGESFQLLYNSSYLKKVRLDNFAFSGEEIVPLFQALASSKNQLEGIFLSTVPLEEPCLQALTEMLQHNNTLSECFLRFGAMDGTSKLHDSVFLGIARALQEHCCLKSFGLTFTTASRPKLSLANQEAFLDAVQHNYNLEHVVLSDVTADCDTQMNFYLALNRMGRKRIVNENATKKDWVDVLENSLVDLNCLYYFLSMRPQLLF